MPHRLSRLLAATVALLLATTTLHAGTPADRQRARHLLFEGNALYTRGNFDAALQLFRQAFAAYPSPKLLVNAAACERALGRRDRAATDLAEFLRLESLDHSASGDDAALVARARADLGPLGEKLGQIVVGDAADDVVMSVDGETTFRVRYVEPGDHTVSLRAPGQPPYEATLHVASDETVPAHRPPPAIESPPPQPIAPPTAAVTLVAPIAPIAPKHHASPHRRRAWVLGVALGTTAIVVGVGLGLGLGLGLHHAELPRGDLGTVEFTR